MHEVIVLKEKATQCDARNAGLAKATGDWVWFVDADDEIVANEFILSSIMRTSADIVVFGIQQRWGQFGKRTLHLPSNDYSGCLGHDCIIEDHAKIVFRSMCNKIFRRSFLLENKITLEVSTEPCEDAIFIIKCLMTRAIWERVVGVGYIYWRRFGSSLFRYCPSIANAIDREESLWDEMSIVYGGVSFRECRWDNRLKKRRITANKMSVGDKDISLFDRLYERVALIRRLIRFVGI